MTAKKNSPTGLMLVEQDHPVLRLRCAEVTEFDSRIGDLASKMLQFMLECDGVGLAAPQVGVARRLFVVRPDPPFETHHVFCNPSVLPVGSMRSSAFEGCLSLPDVRVAVSRPWRVVVNARDAEGRAFKLELEGMPSRIVQHELDHLHGVLITDYQERSRA